MKKAPKHINLGLETLIPKSEWGQVGDIQGNDETVLKSEIMGKAFNRILELHKPNKQIALCSLCTVTRPYSVGRKWKEFKAVYGKYVDLIVNSNGGVIPLDFETCYPYLTYDAHGEKQYDDMYVEILGARVREFFSMHKYRFILFNFRPNLRNTRYAHTEGEWLKENGFIEDYAVMPSEEMYLKSQGEKFASKGFSMFPELYPTMMAPVIRKIKEWDSVCN